MRTASPSPPPDQRGQAPSRALIDVLRLSTEYLAQHGSPTARLDAELITAHALRLRRLDLYLQHDRPLAEPELAAVRHLLRRRAAAEPVAYITGVREFFGRPFAVTPDVLIPRPETEALVEVALRVLRSGGNAGGVLPHVADLGTGSGCIAVTLAAEMPGLLVSAVDASGAALHVARQNAERNGVADLVTFSLGDWAQGLDEPADVVVSNPPYVTTGELGELDRGIREYEPHAALDGGDDGLAAYRELLASLGAHLRQSAAVLLEIDPRRVAAVRSVAVAAFGDVDASVHRDLAGRDRVLELRLR